MTTAITGMQRQDIAAYLVEIVGNNSSAFRSHLDGLLTAWQYEFCNLHDWRFLHINGAANSTYFTTVQGQFKYTLNTATCGLEIDATNIEALYLIKGIGTNTETRRLRKVNIDGIRLGLGTSAEFQEKPLYWAPAGRQEVLIYPTPDNSTERISIDAKILPSELSTDATQLVIPYQYQDLFMQFCLAKALRRERDPRASEEMVVAQQMLRLAISNDKRELENNDMWGDPNEALTPFPNGLTIDSAIWNSR